MFCSLLFVLAVCILNQRTFALPVFNSLCFSPWGLKEETILLYIICKLYANRCTTVDGKLPELPLILLCWDRSSAWLPSFVDTRNVTVQHGRFRDEQCRPWTCKMIPNLLSAVITNPLGLNSSLETTSKLTSEKRASGQALQYWSPPPSYNYSNSVKAENT